MQSYQSYFAEIQRMLQQMETTGVFAKIRVLAQQLNSIVFPSREVLAAVTKAADMYAALLQQIRLPDFEGWAKTEREATAILTARGWWPHPDWPVNLLHEVIRLKRERRTRQLDKLICRCYEVYRARPMRRAIERWMSLPEFKVRRRIFGDGLWAYRRGKYGLAVSHWLPQVEGVLRSFADRQNLAQGSWKRLGHEIVGEHPDYMQSFTQGFLTALRSLYDSSLPHGQHPPRKSGFPVQRDAVLHGVDLNFARRAHAMRIFLMLDTLHYFISSYEEEEREAA